MNQTRSRSSTDTDPAPSLLPNEVIWRDIEHYEDPFMRQAIQTSGNVLTLRKGKEYVVGFVYNPGLDTEGPKSTYIQLLGGMEITDSDFSGGLPTTVDTKEEINVGALEPGETGFESSITLPELSQMLGFSAKFLETYGIYDNCLLKFLNPDINRNGLYDIEEEKFSWMLTASRLYHFYQDDYENGVPSLPIQSFENELFALIFWFSGNLIDVEQSKVFLTLPDRETYQTRNGQIVTGIPCSHSAFSYRYKQYYFNRINEEIISPKPPYDGDYCLDLNGNKFFYQGIEFLSPYENSFEGFIFPQNTFIFNDEGILQKIVYTWWIIRNGNYAKPTLEELQRRVNHFNYCLPKQKIDGYIGEPEISGEYNVSHANIHFSELSYIDQSWPEAVRSSYYDSAQNEWNCIDHLALNRP